MPQSEIQGYTGGGNAGFLQSLLGGIPIVGGAISSVFQGAQNKKARKFAEHMYDRQRKDALADRLFENEYNSPAAMMERVKKAGLNPNLPFGNSNSISKSSDTRSSSPQAWNPKTVIDKNGVSDAMLAMADLRLKGVQSDNIKAATAVARMEAAQKAAETANLTALNPKLRTEAEQARVNLAHALKLNPMSLEKIRADIDQTKVNTEFTMNQDIRNALLNNVTVEKAWEEIKNITAHTSKTWEEKKHVTQLIENAKKEGLVLAFQNKLNEMNLTTHDPSYVRLGKLFIDKVKENSSGIWEWIKNLSPIKIKTYGNE